MKTFVTARAVLLNPEGKLLIVRRSQTDPKHPGTWDIPGGQVEDGETVEDGLRRETFEEVGVNLKNPQLVYATSAHRPEGSGTWIFFMERVADDAKVRLSFEHDEFKWIDFNNLPNYTNYSILLDMQSYVKDNGILQ